MSAGLSFSSRPRGKGDSPRVVVAGWWYQDDLAPLMDFIETLRSAKLFQHCIIGEALSCEVTPKHMHTDIQTNLRTIHYYPCIVHTGSTPKTFIKLMLVIPSQRYILFHYPACQYQSQLKNATAGSAKMAQWKTSFISSLTATSTLHWKRKVHL